MPVTSWTRRHTRSSAAWTSSASSVAVHDKARAEMLVGDARQASKDDAPLDRLRSLELRAAAGRPRPLSAPTPDGGPAADRDRRCAGRASDDDDVIDAEFTAG